MNNISVKKRRVKNETMTAIPIEARVKEEILAFGASIKHLRSVANLTLRDMAQLSGLSQSALSKIENGLIAPNYDSILRIAEGLKVDVQTLFNPQGTKMSRGRRSVTRSDQGKHVISDRYEYEFLCAELSRKKFIPIVATVRGDEIRKIHKYTSHIGEEFVYVITGEVMLLTSEYEPTLLKQGDSCYFDSAMDHSLKSGGKGDAKILWIASAINMDDL